MELAGEREASKPHKQFSAQVEERRRIWNADPSTSWITINPGDNTFEEETSGTVKKRWVEQGIWNNKWDQFAYGRWKHEEPLELESETESNSEPKSSVSLFSISPEPQPKSTQPKSNDAGRQVIREREREASRPYHQFIYQRSKERERIQEESEDWEGASAADINTRAYENIQNIWTKRGIWNGKWGVLLGMSWKHEEPLEDETADDPAPVQANPLVNGSHEVEEALAIPIFGSPSPIRTKCRQVSNTFHSSQQGPPTNTDSAGSENGDAERSFSTSNSPPLSSGEEFLRLATRRASLPNKGKAPYKDEQPADASLGRVHASKVSKTAKKRKRPQSRMSISQNMTYDDLPLSSGVDAAKPQPSLPPVRLSSRRSKRIQSLVSSVAKDSVNTAFTEASKRANWSKSERMAASNSTTGSFARFKGVSKRQLAKTKRGKTRRD